MFIRTKKTPNTPKVAVQLVENVREGKKIKQRLVRHFGYAVDDKETEALKSLALHYKYELESTHLPKLFAKDDLMSMLQSKRLQTAGNESPLPVNLRDIREDQRVCVGIHQCYGSLYDQIGLNRAISNPTRKRASVKLLRDIVMARIVKPASKRSSALMLEQEYGVSADVNSVYRMMDYIDEGAIQRVKEHSFRYSCGLLNDKIDVIFYDCTTLYFESFIEDNLKQNGYSKDGKFNQSQVLLAIMVTQSGLPIGYQLYEGSRFEGHTLDDALEQLHQNYQIDKVIFVADAAMLNDDNIKHFAQKQQPFIVGARLKNMSKDNTKQILDKQAYQSLSTSAETSEEPITYREIILEDRTLRLIVTHSPVRAAKDRHDREKAIESLKKRIKKSSNPTSLLSNYGYKKFVKLEGKAKIITDENKIQEAARWDGLHGIVTNIPQQEGTVQMLLNHYRGLWQVEETFRLSKHDLRMRPIFHWTENRIKAHVAICFMALICIRAMEYSVRLQYRKLSPESIRNELMKLQTSILKDTKTGNQYALPSKATQDAKKIYQIMGLKWTDTPYQLIKQK